MKINLPLWRTVSNSRASSPKHRPTNAGMPFLLCWVEEHITTIYSLRVMCCLLWFFIFLCILSFNKISEIRDVFLFDNQHANLDVLNWFLKNCSNMMKIECFDPENIGFFCMKFKFLHCFIAFYLNLLLVFFLVFCFLCQKCQFMPLYIYSTSQWTFAAGFRACQNLVQ